MSPKEARKAKAEWVKGADYKKLIASGYRIISRNYMSVARIDRPDWQDHCKEKNYPICADWYRRCVSNDLIDGLKPYALKVIPNSGDEKGIQPYQEIVP